MTAVTTIFPPLVLRRLFRQKIGEPASSDETEAEPEHSLGGGIG
jgi:hypothetical protein